MSQKEFLYFKWHDELYYLIIIHKKSNIQILHITFCKYFFFNLKNRNGLPKNYFLFLVFWKLFLKWGPNTYNIKIIIWKLVSISIFWKLFLYCFEKTKNKNPHSNHALIYHSIKKKMYKISGKNINIDGSCLPFILIMLN